MVVPRAIHSVLFFISFALATIVLAACSNALASKNRDFHHAKALVAAEGVKLSLSSIKLDAPGYALSVGAGSILINSLLLFFHTLNIMPMPLWQRRIFFLNPLFHVIGTLLSLAAGIAVLKVARHGMLSASATINGVPIPQSVLQAQSASVGLTPEFWAKGYVRFMAISTWPMLPFAVIATYLSIQYYKQERPAAYHARQLDAQAQGQGRMRAVSDAGEKGEVTQIE
ncbi:hypothetical protein BCR39DRAFT_535825 [Naematelia encephala]|uniref:Transmembrane protein n=1 Tax=Naematelia encephala TaxID=71784 RepID=A0A1Y2B014_9TREE|nr:hypothetical protein BCR39DRAFT_535825 [Naematelia encephala]